MSDNTPFSHTKWFTFRSVVFSGLDICQEKNEMLLTLRHNFLNNSPRIYLTFTAFIVLLKVPSNSNKKYPFLLLYDKTQCCWHKLILQCYKICLSLDLSAKQFPEPS